jgi:predicted small secreted protein
MIKTLLCVMIVLFSLISGGKTMSGLGKEVQNAV